MPFVSAGQLVRSAPTALENDPLGLVADNLRASPYGTLAVLDRVVPVEGEYGTTSRLPRDYVPPRILGLIDERDLSRAALFVLNHQPPRAAAIFPGESTDGDSLEATNGFTEDASTPDIAGITARETMKTDFGFVPAAFSLHNALLTLDRYDAPALPVLDGEGRYRGLVSRADLVAALGGQIRPPIVGGMATPLGVWLTDGRLTSGAPALGLFLSGLVLAACFAFAHTVVLLVLAALNSQWAVLFYSGRVGLASEGGGTFNLLVTVAQGLLFLFALRLTPMAGIHAAEHQTVWALERGVPLTPEAVSRMPRAHPRCGTNIMALVGLVTILLQHLPALDSSWIIFSLLFTFFFWRQFGTALQEYFTTRPASLRQLESGIAAGRELMEKYQAQSQAPAPMPFRLLNSGLLFALGGMLLGTFFFFYLEEMFARWVLGF